MKCPKCSEPYTDKSDVINDKGLLVAKLCIKCLHWEAICTYPECKCQFDKTDKCIKGFKEYGKTNT